MGYFKDDWESFEQYVGIDPADSTHLVDVNVDVCGEKGEKQSVGGGGPQFSDLPSELHFNGDTFVSIPDFALPIASAGRIEIEVQVDNTSGHYVWGSTEVADFLRMDTGGSTSTISIHPFDNSAGTGYTASDRNIWSTTWNGSGSTTVYKDSISSVNTPLGSTQGADGFRIGSYSSDLSLNTIGYLRNVRVYDAETGGNLTHEWQIVDQIGDQGVITDTGTVGGFDGVLTLGTGTWDIRYLPTSIEVTDTDEVTITYAETLVDGGAVAADWGVQITNRAPFGRAGANSITSISGTDVVLGFTSGVILPGDTVLGYYIGDKITTGGNTATKYTQESVINTVAYTAVEADFDGSTWLTRGAALDGVIDGTLGTFFVRFRLDGGDGVEQRFLHTALNRLNFRRRNTNDIQILLRDPTGTAVINMDTPVTVLAGSGWHTLLVSWDSTLAGVSNGRAYVYLDDVDVTTVAIHSNATIDYTETDWACGAATSGTQPFNGCMSNYAFSASIYMDITDAGVRANFYDGSGNAKDPGANGSNYFGAAADILFQNAIATWHVNTGTGGGCTENGALTTCV